MPERALFWRIRGACAVRSGRWKLVAPRAASAELYDLANDPGESRNLAASEPERVAALTAAAAAWEASVGR